MSDEWRRKQYYKPRVLIDVDRILNPQFDDMLICITGAQAEMLRNLTQYLHRRSTFVSTYYDNSYFAPSNEEWDELQEIVAELEDILMGCPEIVAQLRAIANAIRGITGPSATTPAMVEAYVTDNTLQYEDDYGTVTIIPDAKRCATAQLVWHFGYEMITEIFQPIQDKLSDVMIPVAMVAVATWVGTPALGIPVGILLATCWAAIEAWEESQLENVVNGYVSAKDELICAVYEGLEVNAQAAYLAAAGIIKDLPAWSPIDIALGKLLYSPWVIDRMRLAWDNATAWALNNVTAGYCDECIQPIVGDDWIAYRIPIPHGDVEIDHSDPGPEWLYGHVCWLMPDKTMCGAVLEVVAETGNCEGGPSGQEVGCEGERFTQDASSALELGVEIYSYVVFTHNDTQAVAALCPGAEKRNELVPVSGPGEWMATFRLGWSCEGTRTYRVKYVVYEYEAP